MDWLLTGVDLASILSRDQTMFTPRERCTIELKALEQALREAGLSHTEPEPLYPPPAVWPFSLTEADRVFLRINKISGA
jgi:hypothetical protein